MQAGNTSHMRLPPLAPCRGLHEAALLEKLLGNFDQALAHWQELASLSPLDTRAHAQIAWLLARRDGKQAAQHYVRALGEAHPFHRGILETEVGWLKEPEPLAMEERLGNYLEANPTDGWARARKGPAASGPACAR